jgi:hypothetical protein
VSRHVASLYNTRAEGYFFGPMRDASFYVHVLDSMKKHAAVATGVESALALLSSMVNDGAATCHCVADLPSIACM